ncbi:RDD family protein [Aliidiomarina sp. Khilg15.8]
MPANPDHTVFPRAGFARRMGAFLYDLLAIIAMLMLAALVALGFVALLIKLGAIVLGPDQDPASVMEGNPLYMLYLVAVVFWFYGGFWVRGGQTIGMRSWRIKVQNTDGSCIGWKQAFIRFITAALGLGNIGVLFSKENLAWQDRAAKCEVIVLSVEANKLRNWRRFK